MLPLAQRASLFAVATVAASCTLLFGRRAEAPENLPLACVTVENLASSSLIAAGNRKAMLARLPELQQIYDIDIMGPIEADLAEIREIEEVYSKGASEFRGVLSAAKVTLTSDALDIATLQEQSRRATALSSMSRELVARMDRLIQEHNLARSYRIAEFAHRIATVGPESVSSESHMTSMIEELAIPPLQPLWVGSADADGVAVSGSALGGAYKAAVDLVLEMWDRSIRLREKERLELESRISKLIEAVPRELKTLMEGVRSSATPSTQ
jgi:hypothetical protein